MLSNLSFQQVPFYNENIGIVNLMAIQNPYQNEINYAVDLEQLALVRDSLMIQSLYDESALQNLGGSPNAVY